MRRSAPGLGLLLLAAIGTAGAAGVARFLETGGAVFSWDGVSATLTRLDPDQAPSGPGVKAIFTTRPRFLVVLAMAGPETSRGRHRREGEARIFDPSVAPPGLLRTVPFEGEPLAGIASRAAGPIWVLAYRPPGTADAQPHSFIHALDPSTGRLESTSEPGTPTSAIALDPQGSRLYASQKDRIQTYTLTPLVASWQLRSPGLNGPLVVLAGTGTACVVRGSDLALFDPAVIGARSAADRRARTDDASGVIHLPFAPDQLESSDDGRLIIVSGPGALVFVEPASQAMIWPGEPIVGLRDAATIRSLAFPGPGHDLILALLPSGTVSAVRTPPPREEHALAIEPPAAVPPAPGTAPTPAQVAAMPPAQATAPSPAHATVPPPAQVTPPPAAQVTATPPPPESGTPPAPATATPAARQTAEPAAASPESPAAPAEAAPIAAALSGRLTGDRARVRAIVLYGPNNILKEFARARPENDGAWTIPLPPAGVYRVMAIGDGSTPLPVAPGFRSITVVEGSGQKDLDFEVRPAP